MATTDTPAYGTNDMSSTGMRPAIWWAIGIALVLGLILLSMMGNREDNTTGTGTGTSYSNPSNTGTPNNTGSSDTGTTGGQGK